MIPAPPPLPLNPTFQVGADEQAFFNPTLMSCEFYSQNALGVDRGDSFDIARSLSNAEFSRVFPCDFHPKPLSSQGSYPHGQAPDKK
mgnify:CR=1 FL=1